jgi:hypothetical protein
MTLCTRALRLAACAAVVPAAAPAPVLKSLLVLGGASSEEVLPLAKCFVEKVQKDKELADEDKEHLRQLLTILANKMKYDSSYDFSKPDQIEQDFMQYRKVPFTTSTISPPLPFAS